MKMRAVFLVLGLSSSLIAQSQDSTERFGKYKDNYFLATAVGDWSEVKFQFSVQYRLLDACALYLGYTQKSFWNAWDFARSSPFKESNYNPEVFYVLVRTSSGVFRGLQGGVEHESNGRDGPDSRGWNRMYATGTFWPISFLMVRPKVWVPFVVDKENENIRQYRGYGDLEFQILFAKDPGLATLVLEVHKGSNFDVHKGGMQAGLIIKPEELIFGTKWDFLNGSFYFQYWNGMGESLLLFDQPVRRFRMGVILAK